MTQHSLVGSRRERGVGLMEVMISIVIGMLLVLVIYQVYEISESQKRTITSGSDAQQNASYGVFVLGRDISMAGNGIASTATSLDACALLRPIPVLIDAGATDNDPDTITVLYGGSSSLSTPVQFKQNATGPQDYVVPGPVGFSQNDVIAAVQGATCTVSTINAGGVAVDGVTGFSTITHTPVAGAMGAPYNAVAATLINLGQAAAMGRVAYTVDTTGHVLRTQNLLPTAGPVNPVINDVVNLKAQYGLDTDNDGSINLWQDATGGVWSAANLPTQPLGTLRQIRAVRIAIVTRSAQYEKDVVTPQYPPLMPAPLGELGMFCDAALVCLVRMTLSADDQHYRYKVLETSIPLRNAMWN
jgi:type IV pilus assembly protein PilW